MSNIDNFFMELTKLEKGFLNEQGIEPNDHGVFIFISQNGSTQISLDFFLCSYKDWLIENYYVKSNQP